MATHGKTFRDDDTIQQMVDAADAIADFSQGMTFDQFKHDIKTWSATQYQILVIGEASRRLRATFVAACSEVPWNDSRDMRNVLAHGYDAIRIDVVWQTATTDVPAVRAMRAPLLSTHNE